MKDTIMSKQLVKDKQTVRKKSRKQDVLVLDAVNYRILAAGLAVIIAGYVALSATPWDNPIALTVAPVLLVLGYCVIVPIGIMYRKRNTAPAADDTASAPAA